MEGIDLAVSNDRLTLKVVASADLSATQTEELIAELIARRVELLPERPSRAPFEGTKLISAPNMRWYVAAASGRAKNVALQLALMHPGLGWIGTFLSESEAIDFIVTLVQCLPRRVSK